MQNHISKQNIMFGKMKLIRMVLISTALIPLFLSCQHQEKAGDIPADVVTNPISADGEADAGKLPMITFAETEHDFESVIQGEKVTYGFKFKNTGKANLVISKVSTSCGCTATEYPRKSIAPGEEGIVSITFDSRGRLGFQNKTATIIANTQPNSTQLRIKARVITPESLN